MTCDMWSKVNILSKCWVLSSYGLALKVILKILRKRISDSVNDNSVCKTALATPDLLISCLVFSFLTYEEFKKETVKNALG